MKINREKSTLVGNRDGNVFLLLSPFADTSEAENVVAIRKKAKPLLALLPGLLQDHVVANAASFVYRLSQLKGMLHIFLVSQNALLKNGRK